MSVPSDTAVKGPLTTGQDSALCQDARREKLLWGHSLRPLGSQSRSSVLTDYSLMAYRLVLHQPRYPEMLVCLSRTPKF